LPKIYWKKAIGVLACLALLCGMVVVIPAAGTAEAQDSKLFTILHTNDIHSELIPHGPASDYPDYPTLGGCSRIAHEIFRIKGEKAAAGEPVLTLDAGDFSQGTAFGWIETQAAAELFLLQQMGYDATTLGNHEFDEGAGYRAMVLGKAKADLGVTLPILCSNINFDDSKAGAAALKAFYSIEDEQGTELFIQPYTVKTLPNGLKVGIFGLLGVEAEELSPLAAVDGVTFGNVDDEYGDLDENMSFFSRAAVAQQMVDVLTGEDIGCDVVIALSHSGTSEETQLAAFVPGIDVIIGGHSHDLNYPPIMVGDTIVVQAGAYTQYLGELELEYAGGKVSVRNANAIKIDESIPTVPAIDALIDTQYVAGLNANLNALLGGKSILDRTMETDFAGDGGFNINVNPPMVETNLGDLVTDAYRAITTMLSLDGNPTQIAFEANGLMRGSIPKGGRGHFSFYDLVRTIPLGASSTDENAMGYSLVSFYLLGAELQGVLEATLDMGMNDFFVQLSGARYSYNPAAPLNSKVTSFELSDDVGGWTPIEPTGLYKVATNYYAASFLATFDVLPRTNAGTQDPNLNNFLVYYAPGMEMRGWLALYQYIMGIGDLDGDSLANVPPDYKYSQQRITSSNWYLAEGATLWGMETFVLVQNPGADDVHVNVKFQTDTGEEAPTKLQGVVIPANSRRTFKANDYVKDDWEMTTGLSTLVEPIDGDVIVERAMYGDNRAWAHDSIGVTAPSPSPEWYLAEGSTGGGMETWLLVQNPYDSAAHVNISFQTDTGEVAPADLQGVTIPANSRATFDVRAWVPDNYNVSTFVEAQDGLVVCERAMYGGGRTWAHDSIGTPVLSDEWYLAEGSTDGGMETFVLVQNPGATDAKVDIVFQTGAGENAPDSLQGVTIPAFSRRTFKVNDYVTTFDVSTYVECTDGAVVVERAMYGDGRAWAHDSIGATSPDNVCFLAEGSTDGGMETFVLVQNPSATDAKVDIVFQTGAGENAPPALQGVTIPAFSRRTFKVNDYVTTFDVSTSVIATEGEVIVERAMYGNSRAWAHDSIGYTMSVWFEEASK